MISTDKGLIKMSKLVIRGKRRLNRHVFERQYRIEQHPQRCDWSSWYHIKRRRLVIGGCRCATLVGPNWWKRQIQIACWSLDVDLETKTHALITSERDLSLSGTLGDNEVIVKVKKLTERYYEHVVKRAYKSSLSQRKFRINSAMTPSSTSATSLSVVVTLDDLARALNKMRLTESVSVASLYDTILQVKSDSETPPSPLQPTQIAPNLPQAQGKSNYVIWASFILIKYTTNSSAAKDGQDQARKFTLATPTLDFRDPVRVEKRRIMRERMKAEYPNGPPPLIGFYGENRSWGNTDVRDNHGSSEWPPRAENVLSSSCVCLVVWS